MNVALVTLIVTLSPESVVVAALSPVELLSVAVVSAAGVVAAVSVPALAPHPAKSPADIAATITVDSSLLIDFLFIENNLPFNVYIFTKVLLPLQTP